MNCDIHNCSLPPSTWVISHGVQTSFTWTHHNNAQWPRSIRFLLFFIHMTDIHLHKNKCTSDGRAFVLGAIQVSSVSFKDELQAQTWLQHLHTNIKSTSLMIHHVWTAPLTSNMVHQFTSRFYIPHTMSDHLGWTLVKPDSSNFLTCSLDGSSAGLLLEGTRDTHVNIDLEVRISESLLSSLACTNIGLYIAIRLALAASLSINKKILLPLARDCNWLTANTAAMSSRAAITFFDFFWHVFITDSGTSSAKNQLSMTRPLFMEKATIPTLPRVSNCSRATSVKIRNFSNLMPARSTLGVAFWRKDLAHWSSRSMSPVMKFPARAPLDLELQDFILRPRIRPKVWDSANCSLPLNAEAGAEVKVPSATMPSIWATSCSTLDSLFFTKTVPFSVSEKSKSTPRTEKLLPIAWRFDSFIDNLQPINLRRRSAASWAASPHASKSSCG